MQEFKEDFKNRVLVDTSSFIEYLRYGNDNLIPALALNDSIVLSNIVRLELLKGASKGDRKKLLNFLEGLLSIKNFPSTETCQKLLYKLQDKGLSLGIADLLILADAFENKCALLTNDGQLKKAARLVSVKLCLG